MADDDGDLALLGDQLDRSFGAGPEGLPTPAERLAVGRRALRRRRRLTVAATSVAVVAAVGAGAALAGIGGEHGADGPPPPLATPGTITTPSTTSSASPSEQVDAADRKSRRAHRLDQQLVSDQFPASYTSDGRIVVEDGWRIVKRLDDPMGFQPPQQSAGVVVTDGPHTRWMLLTLENQVDGQGKPTGDLGPTSAADDPGKGY